MAKAKKNGENENTAPESWNDIQARYTLETVLSALDSMEARKRYNQSDRAQERRKEYNRRKAILLKKAIEQGIVVTDEEIASA